MGIESKVLFINRGGTISRHAIKGGMTAEEIVKQVRPENKDGLVIDCLDIPVENSSNVTPKDLSELSTVIYNHRNDYDSVVIGHGANTAIHSGVAVALAHRGKLPLPVIIVASQLPHGQIGSDASVNLNDTFVFSSNEVFRKSKDVLVAAGNHKFLRAVRAGKISDRGFDIFGPFTGIPVAEIRADGVRYNEHKGNSYLGQDEFEFSPEISLAGVRSVEIYPGFDPEEELVLGIKEKRYRALIMRGYEAGNVPDSLIKSILMAQDNGIPVIVSTQFAEAFGNEVRIEDQNAIKAGAISDLGYTPVVSFIKTGWLLAQRRYNSLASFESGYTSDFVGERGIT